MNKKTVVQNFTLEEIDTIILDVDGTLLNTLDFIDVTFLEALKRQGVIITKKALRKVVTNTAPDIFLNLAPHIDQEQALKDLTLLQTDLFHTVSEIPGALTFIKHAKKKGKKIATVTSRRKDTGIELLKMNGFSDYIDYKLFHDDITYPKPHPESILMAMEHLGATKHTAVMIGDSVVDVHAGKNAGIKTIGVLTGFDKKILKQSNPDILLKDISFASALFQY